MSKYGMDLNLFAVSLEDAANEISKEECRISYIPGEKTTGLVQAASLQGIEKSIDEILAHMEEDDFILALQGIHFMQNDLEKVAKRQESMEASLKSIAESLKLIAGRM